VLLINFSYKNPNLERRESDRAPFKEHCHVDIKLDLYKMLPLVIRLNAAAFIKFFVIRAQRLFEGGVYQRAAFNRTNTVY